MTRTRPIYLVLLAILVLTLCTGATAQQCTRPAPPGAHPSWNAVRLNRARAGDQQQTMRDMNRGTYGHAPELPGKKTDLALRRRQQIQQKVVSQSARLLLLAQQLNTDAATSSTNQISVAVVKEATKIEKLARSIENKTRNSY